MHFFDLLNLPVSFHLDLNQLEKNYLSRMTDVHPDRFAHQPSHQKIDAAQQAVSVNNAYQTLKSPLKRAVYLLELHDIKAFDDKKTVNDPTLLMENLEAREQLDHIHSLTDLNDFKDKLKANHAIIIDQLTNAFDQKQWETAKTLTIRLQYTTKLLADTDHKELTLKTRL